MIDNQDGTYDFYYECEYCYTMDEMIDLVIRVYPNLEEALENEQKN